MQLRRSSISREQKVDVPCIEGLDISSVTIYQPQLKPKPVVSKPEKLVIVDFLTSEKGLLTTDECDVQLEFKPSELTVQALDQFVL